MNKTKGLYETDFNLWLTETVNLLRNGEVGKLDLENLAEEIEDMGNNRKDALAFAFQDDGGEYKNIGANAKPLQICVHRNLRTRINHDTKKTALEIFSRLLKGSVNEEGKYEVY